MYTLDNAKRKEYANRFESCEDSCILSAISGTNGEMYVDDLKDPKVFLINVSDYSFIAGDEKSVNAKKALSFLDEIHDGGYNIRCVDKGFEPVLEEVFKDRASAYDRFAMERTFKYMDLEALKANVEDKEKEFSFCLIDEKLFDMSKKTGWMRNFTVSYETYEDYKNNGLGVMILKDGEPVAGAGSYSDFPGGIEVEIITREDCRGKGLATAAGSALILECEKRGLVASWDAAHEKSMKLAEKLGYRLLYRYRIYGIKKG